MINLFFFLGKYFDLKNSLGTAVMNTITIYLFVREPYRWCNG